MPSAAGSDEGDDDRPAVTFELEEDDGSLISRIPLFHPSGFVGGCLFGSTRAETTCSGCKNVSGREHEFVCLSVDIDEAKAHADPEGDAASRKAVQRRIEAGRQVHDRLQSAAGVLGASLQG